MRPVLFSIFGRGVQGYGTMIAIGIIFAMLLLERRSKKLDYDNDSIWNMTIITIICGVLGGKILYLITEFQVLIEDPKELLQNLGYGFVIYGAIIGGVLSIWWYAKKKGWNVLKVFDLVIPSVALAQGFGRIGCFLAGCCYGKETKLPIGVVFRNSPFAPSGIHVHPTQLYSSLFDFALGFFLLWYDKKNHKEGQVFSLYMIIYSIGRFFVEFFRNDPRGNVGILSTSQFIAIFTLAVGIIIFNFHKLKKKI